MHPVPAKIRTTQQIRTTQCLSRSAPCPTQSRPGLALIRASQGLRFVFDCIAHGALIQICANRGLPRSVPTAACPDPHHKALRFCWRIEDQLQSRRDQGLSPSHAFDDQSGRGGPLGTYGHSAEVSVEVKVGGVQRRRREESKRRAAYFFGLPLP